MGTSLLTDEARAWIGHAYEERTMVVTEHDIRRFAYASRDAPATAGAGGDGALEAPPMFYVVLRNLPYQVAPLDRLDADGTVSEELPPIPVSRGVAGEIEIEFGRPVRAGDIVTVRKKIVDLVEKSGRSGPFVIIVFLTECLAADGELLVRERFGRILR